MNDTDLLNYQALFENSPGAAVVLTPAFRVVAVSDAYLGATMVRREALVGRIIFEVFPENPDDVHAAGQRNVRASFERVLRTREADLLPVQKYDVRKSTGEYEARYWRLSSAPVFDSRGEVSHILHQVEDVTQVQESLRRNDEHYRFMAESMPLVVFTATPDGSIDYVSQRLATYIGAPVETDAFGGAWMKLVHPDDLSLLMERWTRSLATGEPYEAEHRVRRGDGVYRWFIARALPMLAPDGKIIKWYGTSTDIDDVKRDTAALQDSEARFRAAVSATSEILWTNDATGKMRGAQPTWSAFTGQSTEELQEYGWAKAVHPNDARPTIAAWEKAVADRTTFAFEHRLRGRDGAYRSFGIKAVPVLNTDGTIREWVGVHSDVTDRKRADAATTLLAEAGRVLSSSLDYGSTLENFARLIVPVFADWCSIDLLDRATGEIRRASVMHSDLRKIELAQELRRKYPPKKDDVAGVAQVLRTGQSVWVPQMSEEAIRNGAQTPEHAQVLLDLELRSYICVPLVSRGRTLGALSLVTAESGRAYSEEDVAIAEELGRRAGTAAENAELLEVEQRARVEAERAGRMKDEFLATLSHELRTPLNAILGWSQLIRRGADDPETLDEGLSVIERNARVQVQLIDDLLDMSRIISGKIRLDVQTVDPVAFIESAIETVAPSAEGKGVRLQQVLDHRAGPIAGDPNRLQQIIWNLLSNAIKFTPRGGRVQVLLKRVNSHIEISVSDTGEGIGAEFLPHVFERFRQADASTTRRHGGLGLGLAIVKQLVELHGGTIDARSAGENMGSTFTLSLPLTVVQRAGDDDVRVHPRALPAQLSPNEFASLSGVRVLVVDDEPDARNLIRRVLQDCKAEVLVAGFAAEALLLLEKHRPHVLVSDIGMPVVDGYELLRQIRALGAGRGGDLPAVALTAFARSEDRTRALMAGYLVHVAKPVEPMELVATIASIAGKTGTRAGR